ncbi:NAD(P)H-hydrate dehydratase [Trinickia caryophylli]|uniref:Bifunctional NAD(P)H-hydrate repair enzyme n=1 Tax=Trinickia caryophylli TaxID=28094 RepID=A0A1X7H5D7_TRICW|nr:NAD(P)H-hydrate dehydratase [Trinickia caryophylli]PMS09585.1 NAD(P)H-hydrate dehydratase [Trinickia caryophylli]TRX17282.1 NAD(P)H-hydrate dehydratase [Trinickia caryophylli]WQE11978.1 NAD(P)H-hydrate dehydratase [Trinickia caryophylli]SMF79615.1 yjeF C-terminal region, hydroxyethylthiazole kinase-related/yjeF N-terminal region [Trinickia caryophylli]GLU35629.1 bifunctional NAD(P)H-hydrate repair enzyme [Trinickia caryophylli]
MTEAASSAPPLLVNPQERPVPLYTAAQLREIETQAAAGLPANTLMARAGTAAARCLREIASHDGSLGAGQTVWLAAGPGNNGGDALVCAAELHKAGIAVEVCMPAEAKPADARWALASARAAGVPISHVPPPSFDAYGWLVDGLFGIGLARGLDGAFAALATRIAARARGKGHVLALDVPSGLDSDTGNVAGGAVAASASHTVTFIGAKPGLYMTHGRDLAGTVTVAPLGIAASCGADGGDWADRADRADWAITRLNAPSLFASAFPARRFASHKGTFGSLAVVGGDTGMCGAPILAARAALHAGAGKVHVALLGAGAPPYDPPFPELMLHPLDSLPLGGMDALAIGCGMGTSPRAADTLADVLALDTAMIIDADALNLLGQAPHLAEALASRGASGAACVLTPHPLEAARLLGVDAATVQRDRIAAAHALCTRFGAVVALKGAGTVVASPDGRTAVNPTGNAALATGGTGDVLGGIVGALLAQGLPPFEATLAGVYLHGLAAETLTARGGGPAGLAAGELAPAVRTLLNRLVYPPRE